MDSGLVISFIGHLLLEATNLYNTLTYFTTSYSTLDLLSLLSLVFATAVNNVYSFTLFSLSVSWQRILKQEL
jgi:hypothetical protein